MDENRKKRRLESDERGVRMCGRRKGDTIRDMYAIMFKEY